ncbi:MAG TPA: hypothetical protein VNA28_04520 [Solirubrobacteraceae bacterium]|nr:hypothetical protein [Solirubrobacteraceae bacterium]
MRHVNVGHAGQRDVTGWLGLAAGLVAFALLAFVPAAANAESRIAVATSFPATVVVGSTGLAAQIVVTNQNTAPDTTSTIAATGITLTPTCGLLDGFGCSAAGADPNVFVLQSSATGTGTGCPGRAFIVSAPDAAGAVRVTPANGAALELPAGATCTIGLTFRVAKLPLDSDPVAIGFQTNQHVTATAVSNLGGPASASGTGTVHVKIAAPTLTATVPSAPTSASAADDNAPEIKGTASADAEMINVYATANCTGTPVTNTTAVFTSTGITVFVADNTTTTFSATAADTEDDFSACSSTKLTYVEKTTLPSPTPTSTTPPSPSNSNTPRVTGTAPAGSTVRLYVNPHCFGAPAAQGTAAEFTSAGLVVSVPSDATTTFYATAQSAAGTSTCSTLSLNYTEDSTPPNALAPGGTTPASGANDNAPRITGAAPAGVTIRVYTNAACTGAVAASGTPQALASPGLAVSVADNSTTTFYVTATDPAGNESACSSPGIVYVENSGGLGTVSRPSGTGTATPPTVTPSSATDTAPQGKCAGISGLVYKGTATANVRTGTRGTDVMSGLGGNDVLRGEAGLDCLYGGNGADRLLGGSGNDRLFGQNGDDQLDGGAGRDNLQGGPGRDRMTDRRGHDRFSGGGGNDRIDARDTTQSDRRASDRILCGPGADTVLVDPGDSVARDCERRRVTRR